MKVGVIVRSAKRDVAIWFYKKARLPRSPEWLARNDTQTSLPVGRQGGRMKKIMLVAVIVALALPVAAQASWETPAGKYTGKITSTAAEINGTTANAVVTKDGTNDVATVTYSDGTKEVWKWNAKTLEQVELDKAGKEGQKYGATFAGNGYYVNCKDKAKNICDADIDARFYWVISSTPDSFTYTVYGVPKEKKGDATAKVEKRHEFAFKLAK